MTLIYVREAKNALLISYALASKSELQGSIEYREQPLCPKHCAVKKCRLKDTEAEDCVRYVLMWHMYVRRNMPSHLDLGAVKHDDVLGKRNPSA